VHLVPTEVLRFLDPSIRGQASVPGMFRVSLHARSVSASGA
jgi:hypothetical protein